LNFSYSSLTTFLQCPYKWYRTYILGEKASNYYLDLGIAVHKFCEEYLKKEVKADSMRRRLFELIENSSYYSNEMLEEINSIMDYKNLKYFDKILGGRNITVESFVKVPFKQTNLLGKLDVLIEEPEKIVIVDFKTSKKYKGEYNSDWMQLYLYAYIYSQMMYKKKKSIPDTIQVVLWYLRDNTIEVEYAKPENLEEAFYFAHNTANQILNYMNQYDSGKQPFKPSKNKFCGNCDFKEICVKENSSYDRTLV
jgi:CRISPR/Cas system-associated exonuclease Cas4 (RecB family)